MKRTFHWMKDKGITLTNDEQYTCFKELIRLINQIKDFDSIDLYESYDFELLRENSTLSETTGDFTIYEYQGPMPVLVQLDNVKYVEDYIFYKYNDSDYAVDENKIYLNSQCEVIEVLQKLAADDNNTFTFEHLFNYYKEKNERTVSKTSDNGQYNGDTNSGTEATIDPNYDPGLPTSEQIEANEEARKVVLKKLQADGFDITRVSSEFSTIDGVQKGGVEYPLVVKSYKNKNASLKIGMNEWKQLTKPNALFWMHLGNQQTKCINVMELFQNQQNLSITFSTENLLHTDRLQNFAELLGYFSKVYINFDRFKLPKNNIAENFENYRFNERRTEEDLSMDDENIL